MPCFLWPRFLSRAELLGQVLRLMDQTSLSSVSVAAGTALLLPPVIWAREAAVVHMPKRPWLTPPVRQSQESKSARDSTQSGTPPLSSPKLARMQAEQRQEWAASQQVARHQRAHSLVGLVLIQPSRRTEVVVVEERPGHWALGLLAGRAVKQGQVPEAPEGAVQAETAHRRWVPNPHWAMPAVRAVLPKTGLRAVQDLQLSSAHQVRARLGIRVATVQAVVDLVPSSERQERRATAAPVETAWNSTPHTGQGAAVLVRVAGVAVDPGLSGTAALADYMAAAAAVRVGRAAERLGRSAPVLRVSFASHTRQRRVVALHSGGPSQISGHEVAQGRQ